MIINYFSSDGIYYRVGHYAFLGNYATTVGDFCSGMSTGSASSGHMYSYSAFTFTSTSAELEDMWNIGYKILAGSTESINAANEMLANGTILESEKATTYNYIGQFHALKALAGYYLVNLYALPYSESNKSQPGIIIIDKEVRKLLQQSAVEQLKKLTHRLLKISSLRKMLLRKLVKKQPVALIVLPITWV